MTELRRRMYEDMQLHGLAGGTQEAYVRSVRTLAEYYRRPPDQLTEDQIRRFFLHLINERRVAEGTLRIYRCAIQFFYATTLQRPWPVFDLVQPAKRRKLPVVLSPEEIRHLILQVKTTSVRMCLTMIYSCGLRLQEGTHLQLQDIDSHRMAVHIRNGKGGQDRYVPLPQRSLIHLRTYWVQERPRKPWLFPDPQYPHEPISRDKPYKILKAALPEAGIVKPVNVHTLRHSYATHLLEAGVNLRVIQEILGHRSPKTTAIYTHLTPKMLDQFRTTLDRLMANL